MGINIQSKKMAPNAKIKFIIINPKIRIYKYKRQNSRVWKIKILQ